MRTVHEVLTGIAPVPAAKSVMTRSPCGGCGEGERTFRWLAPIGTVDAPDRVAGRAAKKPWEYQVTAAIPHLNTIDELAMCVAILRAQTLRPYIIIIDTGSPLPVQRQLESWRCDDLEVNFIGQHGFRHSSESVTSALDIAQALCKTEHLFHSHSDCFLRRRDLLEDWAKLCTPTYPAVGYRMSPRDWVTDKWEWMVGHTALMTHMPTLHRIGATWSMQRAHDQFGYELKNLGGWPDTETGFNEILRKDGLTPMFMGEDTNHERQVTDDFDHPRSFAGSKTYSARYHADASRWMAEAMRAAQLRLTQWQS